MIGYHLSRTGVTAHPFYISHIGIGLTSVEELCYFICQYPALVDETVLNQKLTRWLAEEFRLNAPALAMERGIRRSAGLEDILPPFMRDVGYLDAGEQKAFRRILEALETGGAALRLKMKGDALVRNRRFGEAAAAYTQAENAVRQGEEKLHASILHNKGVALMQLLSYEEAYRAFRAALALEDTPERKRVLLIAAGIAKPRALLLPEADEIGADPDTVKLVEETLDAAAGAEIEIPEDLPAALESIRSAYHREAGT